MPAEDHLEGRDVDAEFAAIIAGWDLTPDLSSIERDGGDEANAAAPAAVPPASPEVVPEVVPEVADEEPGGPGSVAPADPAPATAADLPSMPGFPDIASAVPVPTPAPTPVGREVPPPGAIEQSLDEHFVPDPVELPPQEDLHFWGIVIGLVAGPLLLLWSLLFGQTHSRWWVWIGAALTLGGFALLVLRQPKDRDDEDDGARV